MVAARGAGRDHPARTGLIAVSGQALAEIAALLLIVAAFLWIRSTAARRRSGLPLGEVIYDDTGSGRECEKPLYSEQHRLSGKPDHLVRRKGRPTPVEVKPRRGARTPYESDVLQVAAYCLLLEETEGSPAVGLLCYQDHTFQVPYTDALRDRLLDTLERMRLDPGVHDVVPQHGEPRRCQHCGYRDDCDRSLA